MVRKYAWVVFACEATMCTSPRSITAAPGIGKYPVTSTCRPVQLAAGAKQVL